MEGVAASLPSSVPPRPRTRSRAGRGRGVLGQERPGPLLAILPPKVPRGETPPGVRGIFLPFCCQGAGFLAKNPGRAGLVSPEWRGGLPPRIRRGRHPWRWPFVLPKRPRQEAPASKKLLPRGARGGSTSPSTTPTRAHSSSPATRPPPSSRRRAFVGWSRPPRATSGGVPPPGRSYPIRIRGGLESPGGAPRLAPDRAGALVDGEARTAHPPGAAAGERGADEGREETLVGGGPRAVDGVTQLREAHAAVNGESSGGSGVSGACFRILLS